MLQLRFNCIQILAAAANFYPVLTIFATILGAIPFLNPSYIIFLNDIKETLYIIHLLTTSSDRDASYFSHQNQIFTVICGKAGSRLCISVVVG